VYLESFFCGDGGGGGGSDGQTESQVLTDESALCYKDDTVTACRRMRSGVLTISVLGSFRGVKNYKWGLRRSSGGTFLEGKITTSSRHASTNCRICNYC